MKAGRIPLEKGGTKLDGLYRCRSVESRRSLGENDEAVKRINDIRRDHRVCRDPGGGLML
jgi:hypothetical protein